MIFTIAIMVVVLADTWIIDPIAPNSVVPIPAALVIALAIGHAMMHRDWGVQRSALVPALRRSMALTLVAAAGMYLAGVRLGTWHQPRDLWMTLLALIPWGFGQQFALHTVFLRDAQRTMGRSAGIVVAAALFAALHLPNPFLSAMTFAGALAWCWIYDRYPNLLPLALSHALLTLAILYAFDERLTGHLRVGAAYLALK
jgi:membrane protease YdiL (CAAX protease family)